MIVVYPFSLVDQDLALKNAKWMNELGGCKGHECLMIADQRCQNAIFVLNELKQVFDSVYNFPAHAEINGWPEGANYMFRLATSWMDNAKRKEFLWLEPDAIPLTRGWLDFIQREYDEVAKRMGKRFMGDRVQVENIPLHMSGVGIYPSPLHAYAGEAYRAHEVAWDMAGKDQIVPKAHFTKLIEHAWKHPKFTSIDELETQIRPECVLFHSSKDGSLIDLLQSKMGKEIASMPTGPPQKEREEPRSPSPISCDIFIRTYPKDYDWLTYCLRSIDMFCTGFRKVWIISTEDAPAWFSIRAEHWAGQFPMEWKKMNEETSDGYLAQQIHKLYADVITDYQPDYILLLDSDTLFTKPVTPEAFFYNGKLIWYMTDYNKIETPWKPVTEKFMGKPVQYEFMRRLPMMMPRWLFPKLREYCHKTHGIIMSDYIRNQPLREFSEFNALGAFAHQYYRNDFEWSDTLEQATPAPLARQFFSWGGITDEVKKEIDSILGIKSEPLLDTTAAVPPNGEIVVTIMDEIRYHVGQLAELCHEKPRRRATVVEELRRKKLVPMKFR